MNLDDEEETTQRWSANFLIAAARATAFL